MDKDFDLNALLAEAAVARAEPSAALTARILADAAKLQPRPQPLVRPAILAKPQVGFFGRVTAFADGLGGGRTVAGLTLAGLTGLYLGVAQPAAVQSLTALLSGTTTVEQMDFLPATGTLWTEN